MPERVSDAEVALAEIIPTRSIKLTAIPEMMLFLFMAMDFELFFYFVLLLCSFTLFLILMLMVYQYLCQLF